MSQKKQRMQEECRVLDRNFLLFVIFSAVMLSLSLWFFLKRETDMAFFLLVIGVAGLLGVLLMPFYYVFSPQKLTVVWLLPFKKTIPWGAVNGIVEYKLFETVKDLPKYEIIYRQNYKGETVVKTIELPRNRKTKLLIEKYAKHRLV